MNIFHIPSWYPSENNPIYGTFIKEQIEMLARESPDWNHGVSTWGQGDQDHMLWVKDHIKNIAKLTPLRQYHSDQQENKYHYHQPCLTWTRKLFNGNLNRLKKLNEEHFDFFRQQTGSVNLILAQATYPAALIAEHLSKKFSVPYFVTLRMSPFPFKEFLNSKGELKSWIKRPLENAKGLITPSHALKERLETFGFQHVHVIPNPVDTDFFTPLENFKSEKITALTVGRMVHQKGIDLLIRAIHELGHDFPVNFRIGGDGADLKKYQSLAEELDVANKISWLGELSREQVRDEIQRCSFYVLPSRHETFGNVLLEAMACGKPVVATRCGGPEDIVTEESGVLCDINPSSITCAIKELLKNQTHFTTKTISDSCSKKYSPNVFALNLENTFLV